MPINRLVVRLLRSKRGDLAAIYVDVSLTLAYDSSMAGRKPRKRIRKPKSVKGDELTRLWDDQPAVIRGFLDLQPQYEQLCDEVAYILRKRLTDAAIEVSAVVRRAKTLKSFAEKLLRKSYDDPLREVTDLAGVRVVYLYKADRAKIEKIIEGEFETQEKIDKVEIRDVDEFGYGALHYLVRLGRQSSGARYDDLKNLLCEIQVRTVLQDAWAIIDHHLSYKHEADIPKQLRRKLNSLSGLFETADDQFDRLREERQRYLRSVRKHQSSKIGFLDQELNTDAFQEYLIWRFPNKKPALDPGHLSRIAGVARELGMNSLKSIDNILARTEKAREAMAQEQVTEFGAGEVARGLALIFPTYRVEGRWTSESRDRFERFAELVDADKTAV